MIDIKTMTDTTKEVKPSEGAVRAARMIVRRIYPAATREHIDRVQKENVDSINAFAEIIDRESNPELERVKEVNKILHRGLSWMARFEAHAPGSVTKTYAKNVLQKALSLANDNVQENSNE